MRSGGGVYAVINAAVLRRSGDMWTDCETGYQRWIRIRYVWSDYITHCWLCGPVTVHGPSYALSNRNIPLAAFAS